MFETELEFTRDKMKTLFRENIELKMKNEDLQNIVLRLNKMFTDYEDIKTVLSLAGDNPNDYGEDIDEMYQKFSKQK